MTPIGRLLVPIAALRRNAQYPRRQLELADVMEQRAQTQRLQCLASQPCSAPEQHRQIHDIQRVIARAAIPGRAADQIEQGITVRHQARHAGFDQRIGFFGGLFGRNQCLLHQIADGRRGSAVILFAAIDDFTIGLDFRCDLRFGACACRSSSRLRLGRNRGRHTLCFRSARLCLGFRRQRQRAHCRARRMINNIAQAQGTKLFDLLRPRYAE